MFIAVAWIQLFLHVKATMRLLLDLYINLSTMVGIWMLFLWIRALYLNLLAKKTNVKYKVYMLHHWHTHFVKQNTFFIIFIHSITAIILIDHWSIWTVPITNSTWSCIHLFFQIKSFYKSILQEERKYAAYEGFNFKMYLWRNDLNNKHFCSIIEYRI